LHITFTLLFKIKASTPFECKYQIVLATFLVFVDVSEDSIMADDAVTPLNLLVVLAEDDEFKETSFDVNVFQQS
jgi:hypothetical protein